MSNTRVKAVAQITPELLEAMSRLISQLSPSATIPTEDEFRQNIGSPAITLLASRTDGILTGSAPARHSPVPGRQVHGQST